MRPTDDIIRAFQLLSSEEKQFLFEDLVQQWQHQEEDRIAQLCQQAEIKNPLFVIDPAELTADTHPVVSEQTIEITYPVKVQVHQWCNSTENCGERDWDGDYLTLEEAIKAWDFGLPRIGAHHMDRKICHVSQHPRSKKWILLYY